MKILDPHGLVAKAKVRMSPDCSVRQSKFCEEIIAQRLQGRSLYQIADWLKEQGTEHFIPPPTLHRNLRKALSKDNELLPLHEEIAEKVGGDIPFDPYRDMMGQALMQKLRIDYMVRNEIEKRKGRPGYANPRIRQEMETYILLVDAAAKFGESVGKGVGDQAKNNLALSDEASTKLAEMILSGDIKLPTTQVGKKPVLSVVSGGKPNGQG